MPNRKTPHKPLAQIESRIRTVRGHKVILDSDLAAVYSVTTKALNQAVRRNLERFPEDFVFQLQKNEFDSLILQNATSNQRSQIVTLKKSRGAHRKYLPYAFTEHGAIMAARFLRPAAF